MDTEFVYRKVYDTIQRFSRQVEGEEWPAAGEIEKLRKDVDLVQRLLEDPIRAQDLKSGLRQLEDHISAQCLTSLDILLADLEDLEVEPDYEEMQRLVQLLALFDPSVAAKTLEVIEKRRKRRDSLERVASCRRMLEEAKHEEESLLHQAQKQAEKQGWVETPLQDRLPKIWERVVGKIIEAMPYVLPADGKSLEGLEREAKSLLEKANRSYQIPVTRDTEGQFALLEEEWAASPPDSQVFYFNQDDRLTLMPVAEAREQLRRRWAVFVNEKIREYIGEANRLLEGDFPNPAQAARYLRESQQKDLRLDLLSQQTQELLKSRQEDIAREHQKLEQLNQQLEEAKALEPLSSWRRMQEIRRDFASYWGGEQHPDVRRAVQWVDERVRATLRDMVTTGHRQLIAGDYESAQRSAAEIITFCEDPSAVQAFGDLHERARVIYDLSTTLPDRIEDIRRQLGQAPTKQLEDEIEFLVAALREAGFEEELGDIRKLRQGIEALENTQHLIRRLNAFEDELDNSFNELYGEAQRAREYLKSAPRAQRDELEDAIQYVEALTYLTSGRSLPASDLKGRRESFERASQHLRCHEAAERELEDIRKQLKNNRRISGRLPHLEKACDAIKEGPATLEEVWELYNSVAELVQLPSTRREKGGRLDLLRERVTSLCRERVQSSFEFWDPNAPLDQPTIDSNRQWVDRFRNLVEDNQVLRLAEATLIQWEAQALERERKWSRAAEKWGDLSRQKLPRGNGLHSCPEARSAANCKLYLWEIANWTLEQDSDAARNAQADIDDFMRRYGKDPDLLVLTAQLEDRITRGEIAANADFEDLQALLNEAFAGTVEKVEEALKSAQGWRGEHIPAYEKERWKVCQGVSELKSPAQEYLIGEDGNSARVELIQQQRKLIAQDAQAARTLKQIATLLTHDAVVWKTCANSLRSEATSSPWALGPLHVKLALEKAEHLSSDTVVTSWIRPGLITIRRGTIGLLEGIWQSEFTMEEE